MWLEKRNIYRFIISGGARAAGLLAESVEVDGTGRVAGRRGAVVFKTPLPLPVSAVATKIRRRDRHRDPHQLDHDWGGGAINLRAFSSHEEKEWSS